VLPGSCLLVDFEGQLTIAPPLRLCDVVFMSEPDGATKAYLEYLDKEMTIMGILSTFCVAAGSLVIDRTAGAEKTSYLAMIWAHQMGYVLFGSTLLMAAGLFFYLQRSRLAHFYGSICMSIARPGSHYWDTRRWLLEAYSWATWLRYRLGFMFLTLTVIVLLGIILRNTQPDWAHWPVWCGFVLVALGFPAYNLMLSTYRYENEPRAAFSLQTLVEDWRNREDPSFTPHSPRRRAPAKRD
jgi:hypothetical protein